VEVKDYVGISLDKYTSIASWPLRFKLALAPVPKIQSKFYK